jgi:hypothetical protein
MDDGKRGLEENVANVKMLPMTMLPIANWACLTLDFVEVGS